MRLQAPSVAVPNFSSALSLASQGNQTLQRSLSGFGNRIRQNQANNRQKAINTASNQALLQLGQAKDQAALDAVLAGVDPSTLSPAAAAALAQGQSQLLARDQTRAAIAASQAQTAGATGRESRASQQFQRQELVNDFYARNADTIEQAEYLRSVGRTGDARALVEGLDFSGAGLTRADLTAQREANDSIDSRRIGRNNDIDSNTRSNTTSRLAVNKDNRAATAADLSNRTGEFNLNQNKEAAERAASDRTAAEDGFRLAIQEAQNFSTPQEAAGAILNNPNFNTRTQQAAISALPGIHGNVQDPNAPILSPEDEAGFVNDLVQAETIEAANASDPKIRFNQRAQRLSESGDVGAGVVEALGEGTTFNGVARRLPFGSTGTVSKFEVNRRVNQVREKARSAGVSLTDSEIGSALIEKNLNVDDAFDFLETTAAPANRTAGFERSILNGNTVQNATNLRTQFTNNERLLANPRLSAARRSEIRREQAVIRARLESNRNR